MDRGSGGRTGEAAGLDAGHDLLERHVEHAGQIGIDVVADPFVSALAHEPVVRGHDGFGDAPASARAAMPYTGSWSRVPTGERVVFADVVVRGAGLVIEDEQPAVGRGSTRSTEPRNRMMRPSPSVSSIGPKRCSVPNVSSPNSAPVLVVGNEPGVECVVDDPLLALPEQPAARETAGIEARANSIGDVVQALAICEPSAFADELIEDLVHDRAAVDGPHFDDSLGLFDRIDVQHVLHEVGMRAADPLLESGR